MNDRELKQSPETHVLLPALSRLGFPVFLFGIVFLSMTIAVTQLATPDRFPVRIGDRVVRLIDLEAEQKDLMTQKADLEMRSDVFSESRAPVLHQLTVLRRFIKPVGEVLLRIDDTRAGFRSGDRDPISLPQITVTGSGSRIAIVGEVRTDGDHSMQVLASFVDGLRGIPMVASVSEPEYTQRKNLDGTTMSPFSVTLSLRTDDHQ